MNAGPERLYPYVLAPRLTTALWGGGDLVRRFGKHGDPNATLGESWECWDENTVVDGTFAGTTLGGLRKELGRELTGPIDPNATFPVLTKFIDARDALSVQVHPDDAYAQRVEHQPNGKTECWYVLDADAGAEIVLGWKRDTSREEYERRVADGTLGEILRRVPVRAHDVFYLPAGTVHAIGAGIRLFETQQASDLTYRMFDWNRVDADGKPRQLHVEKAADVLDYRATSPNAAAHLRFRDAGTERELLVADRRFLVERVAVDRSGAMLVTDGRPLIITAMETTVTVDLGATVAPLARWSTLVTPAATDRVSIVAPEVRRHVLVVRPQPDLDRARAAAHDAGCDPSEIDDFFNQFAA